jgi:multidrug efflux pump subunit AcrB
LPSRRANPTSLAVVATSVREVVKTIFVAILLVVAVVFLFLQTWRASLIPVIAIPISLVGTFTILLVFGISLNNLSLFGLVLAVGIVVDDATSSISTGSLRIQTDCALIWSISAGH